MKQRHVLNVFFAVFVAGAVFSLWEASAFARAAAPLPPPVSETLLVTANGVSLEANADTYQHMNRLGRLVVGQHEVKAGETLAGLAKRYATGLDYLRSTNRLESVNLPPGKVLVVHNGPGMLHQIRETKGRVETLAGMASRYGVKAHEIARANKLPGVSLLSADWMQPGQVVLVPRARLRFTDYLLPVAWARGKRLVSSGFGYRRHPLFRYKSFHTGWDMPRPYGTPVQASREGRVIFSGWRGGYGRLIIVKHLNGWTTWYGHLSASKVNSGQRVKKGQVIGAVGSSGYTTGPHLHFEVRDKFGNALNPRKFLL